MSAHDRGKWTRSRLAAVAGIAGYVAVLTLSVPPEPGQLLRPGEMATVVASGLAIGYFIRSWWPLAVPFLLMAVYGPYAVWFSDAARSGYGPDPALITRGNVEIAVSLAATVLLGQLIRTFRSQRMALH